jgi:hypothetical protein
MKRIFTKSQISILTALGLIGVTFLVIPIINHSDKYLMPIIASISLFLFGMYRNYLKNKRFVGKGSKIFLLYNRKRKNTFNLVLIISLIAVIIFVSIYIFSIFGLILTIGVSLYVSLSLILFPYGNGYLIMIDNTAIYSYETGFIKLNQIKTHTLKTESMLLEIELKNNERKSIEYNKFLNIELFKKELEMKFEN